MSLLTSLLILIVVARLLGSVFTRLGQPAMIGEMLAGILLGPAIFGVLDPSPALAGVAELAVFLVILSAGLEMRFEDILAAMKGGGFRLAVISFTLPFLGGVGIAWYYELDAMRSIFLGLCISITALPVAAKILENMGLLDTPIGRYSLATAIINDVAAMMVLGMVLAMPHMTSVSDVASALGIALLKLIALIALVLAFNQGLGWLERRGVNVKVVPERLVSWFGAEALFGIVVLFVLIFGSMSEALGFHFVIGAFFGALLLDKRQFLASRYDELKLTLGSLTGGFLAPVFFAYLGLEFDIDALKSPGFVTAVLVVSILTKVFAGMWGGQAIGMSRRESLGLGFMLNGRGVMELVVASIAYQKGFIGPGIYSTLVLMGVVTTMLTPWLFSRAFPEKQLAEYRQRHAVSHSESA